MEVTTINATIFDASGTFLFLAIESFGLSIASVRCERKLGAKKGGRQMKISIAASGARANSPPLVEWETRWNITKVFLGSPLSFLEIKRGEKS